MGGRCCIVLKGMIFFLLSKGRVCEICFILKEIRFLDLCFVREKLCLRENAER